MASGLQLVLLSTLLAHYILVHAAVSSNKYKATPSTHKCARRDPDNKLLYAARTPSKKRSDLSNKDPNYVHSMEDYKKAGYQSRPTDYRVEYDLNGTPKDIEKYMTPGARGFCAGTTSSENNTTAANPDPIFNTAPPLNPGRTVDIMSAGESGYFGWDRMAALGLQLRHDDDPERFYTPAVKTIVERRSKSTKTRRSRSDGKCVTFVVLLVAVLVLIVLVVKVINKLMPSDDDYYDDYDYDP